MKGDKYAIFGNQGMCTQINSDITSKRVHWTTIVIKQFSTDLKENKYLLASTVYHRSKLLNRNTNQKVYFPPMGTPKDFNLNTGILILSKY